MTTIVQQEMVAVASPIPATTKMLFFQAAAPTGWTKDTTHNDKALRVVSGSGGGSGGSTAFSSVMASRTPTGSSAAFTLTTNEIPSHRHGGVRRNSADGGAVSQAMATTPNDGSGNTDYTGSGNSHSHTLTLNAMDFAVQYIDLIVCTKS